MRTDLLNLTTDDLVLFANRGLLRRAQQEVDAGDLSFMIAEDQQGKLSVEWSDGVRVEFAAQKPANTAHCSCPATTLCRHVLRSVLAYQQYQQTQGHEDQHAPQGPWNPGEFEDQQLEQALTRKQISWARKAFSAGHVIELVRSAKPSAYIHTLACTVRFLVHGNLSYCHCDCGEQDPCWHVALAVWAFRKLPTEQTSGLIETAALSSSIPHALLDSIEGLLKELLAAGLSQAAGPLPDRMRRIEARCHEEGLIWPAEILGAIVQQYDAYIAHDARFSPQELAALIGELCVRCDAIRHATGAVPQLFVRGSSQDAEASSATARLIGVGCGVRLYRGGAELFAVMQETDSGRLLALTRDLPTQDGRPAVPFWQAAQMIVAQGNSLAQFGSGQLLVKGGKRLPSARFVLGRAKMSYTPQSFAWESLRAPVFAEDFNELTARLVAQPPAALRPRRLSDSIHVVAVSSVEHIHFDIPSQEIRAELGDQAGKLALLRFPYQHRAASGAEALLEALRMQGTQLRFVAGHTQLAAGTPLITPIALVLQEGLQRRMLMPWIAAPTQQEAAPESAQAEQGGAAPDALQHYWNDILEGLSELLLSGAAQAGTREARRWQALEQHGRALGFERAIQPVVRLSTALQARSYSVHWDAQELISSMLELLCLTQFTHAALSA